MDKDFKDLTEKKFFAEYDHILQDILPITPPPICDLQKFLLERDIEYVNSVTGINADFLDKLTDT